MIGEGVAGGVVIALLGGLTTLAYKHPKGYARLHEIFWRILCLVFGIYSVFIFGVKFGITSMWPFIDAAKFKEAEAAGPNLWTFIYAWVIFIALLSYLGFLRYLPKLVGKDDEFVPESGFVIPLVSGGQRGELKKSKRRSPNEPQSR